MTASAHLARSDVRGIELDAETRCAHYRTARDVVAIRMKCCGVYYACKACHDALAGHALEPWPRAAWDEKAALCGACGTQMTVREYLGCGNVCPGCSAPFNPECRHHHHFYFDTAAEFR
jgi:uncharacterized CHY-type Zn-finger protein